MTRDLTALEPEAWRERGAFEDYRGERTFVLDEGAGERVLLCLHGFPTSSWDWHRIWPGLTARFRAIAPDFIGFGFSAKPRAYEYSILDQADLIEGVLRRRGLNDVHLLVHDIGDTVAQELIARQLDGGATPFASLTLLNGGLFPETHRPVTIQKLLLSPLGPLVSRMANERMFRRSFGAIFGPRSQPSAVDLRRWWRIVSGGGGSRISHLLIRYMHERERHRERWVGALVGSPVPIRLINGLLDSVSGAHVVARFRELVTDPDVVELPAIGHYPQLEDPDTTLKAVLSGPASVSR